MNDAQGVTVIGLGPMGQAMVRTFLADDHPTTVWNRTPARAALLVAEGAVQAATVAEALHANELVIVSLTDYQAMYDLLDPVGEALAGKVVVNLSSDTPRRSREAATWLAERKATLLVGGIMVPAPLVGTDAAYVFYSGPRPTFDAHEPTLRLIGKPDYRGDNHALAQLFYQAQLDIFLTSLSAYLHATALLKSAGVPATTFRPYAAALFDGMASYLDQAAAVAVDQGQHPGALATVLMMGATADHVVGASEDAGIDTALPAAVKSHYDQAIAAGHGTDSWTSLYEVISTPPTST
ncbi:NAD(P)-binding domain-containing protein [Umezawaea sp. Da 62-37]|uniref:NAD(P)-dependent oxidoreductase n=1 Tax=Umezawaea sp. Da 62-37 TaxID=3075927 RepID=UPI0028F6C78E|nr:NAD(P)-binding domain-containing protein [Umezawaea sp. Da 62-37]WNV87795.1 NAD(P)-binding domain-containing protein [Umezawaea sp. Da 62-37]